MRVSDIGNIHIRLTFYPSKAIQSTMKICYNHMFSRLNITTMNPSTQSFVIILFILVFRDSSIKCTNMLWHICIFDMKFRMYYITSTCDTKFRAWCEVLTKIMHLNYSHMTSKLTENTWYTFLFFSFSFFYNVFPYHIYSIQGNVIISDRICLILLSHIFYYIQHVYIK